MSAEEKNLILFERMAKKMRDEDFENFREATSLLTTWLSKRQAYYPDALLQIIRLLFIAQLRVRDEVNFDHGRALLFKAQRYSENHFAAAYIKLINAVLPFQDVFSEAEKGLREGYQQLVASVSGDLPENEIPRIPQTRSPTPRPTNLVEFASKPPTPISELVLTSQAPSVATPDLESLSLTSCTPNERIGMEASMSASPAPTFSIPQHTESSPPPESKENTHSANCKHHISTPAEPQITPEPPAPTEVRPNDIINPPAFNSKRMRAVDMIPHFPSSPIADTAPLTSSPSIRQQPAPTLPQQIETLSTKTLDSDPPEKSDLQNTHTPRDQQQSSAFASEPRSDISAHPGLHKARLTETVAVTINSNPVSGIISTDTEQNPPLGFTRVANQMEVDPTEVQSPWNEPIAATQDLSQLIANAAARMKTDGDVHEGRNEAPSRGKSTEVDALGSGKPTVPPNPILGQAVNGSHAPTELINSTIDFPPARVELGVIARQQGLKDSFRIFIEFDITSSQIELVKRWSKRSGSLTELKSSICITLGCYLLADLKVQFDTGRLSSFEQQVACTPSKWPKQRGSLSLKVISAESKEENLPLSPPFQVTPNNLLDISDLVAEGKNKLQLHQTSDLRHFLFVLHAHHPTRQQLEQVQDYMHKKKEWQLFLQDFAAPFAYDSFRSLLSNQVESTI